MSRVAFGSILGTAGAALVLALLLLAASSDRAGATSPPAGFDIFTTGVDTDGSDNTGTSIGTIDSQTDNIGIGEDVCIDIVVDEVPAGGTPSGGNGIFGIGMNIHWNGSIAGLVGYRAGDKNQGVTTTCPGNGGQADADQFLYSSQAPFDDQSGDDAGAVFQSNGTPNPTNAAPNTTGDFRIDNVWTDPTEVGAGRLAQFVFRCSAEGTTTITVDDPPPTGTGGNDKVGVLFAEPAPGGVYAVANESEATLFCDTEPGETPTDGPTPSPTPVDTGETPTDTPVDTGETPTDTGPTPSPTPVNTNPTPSPTPVNTNPTPTPTPVNTNDTPTPTPIETDTATPVGVTKTMGDTDCSGTVGARDNQALLRNILGQSAISQTEPCPDIGTTIAGGRIWGDWDCSGSITARDNQAVLRFILGQTALSQTEPCPDIGQPITIS